MATEKLQKILAHAGIASRRHAEQMIESGLVTINGKIAKIGDRADPEKDAIKFEGKLIRPTASSQSYYYVFNKPKQVIPTVADSEGRPALGLYLPDLRGRMIPVAPLPFVTEGLMFLTNDGTMAQKLQKNGKIKTLYEIKIRGRFTEEQLKRARKGMRIESLSLKPSQVEITELLDHKSVVALVVDASHTLDIKTYFDNLRSLIERVRRVSYGHIELKNLPLGEKRVIEKSSLEALFTQPELADTLLTNYFKKHTPKAATPYVVSAPKKAVITPRGTIASKPSPRVAPRSGSRGTPRIKPTRG